VSGWWEVRVSGEEEDGKNIVSGQGIRAQNCDAADATARLTGLRNEQG